ncbi:MAG: shikimate dehydrogenase [Armatimonadota bacterium]|nr:shikimate dehydrogenase [Armatimonadota bacterium]
MEKFAFIIHPFDVRRDVAKKGGVYSAAKYLPEPAVEWAIQFKSPLVMSHITGIQSPTGAEAEGWFIGCPLTPKQMLSLPQEFVYKRLIQCGKLAESLGAKIIGLGAFTSIVGDGGITVAKNLDIAVTTGNSYTTATAVEGGLDAARRMGIDMEHAKVAVVGATGSIGKTCAQMLAPKCAEIALVGRDLTRLEGVGKELSGACVQLYDDVHLGLRDADLILTVTSATDAVIEPEDLKPGSVVCDVARPRDVSVRVAKERDDVLVIEGGVVAVPGKDADFHFQFGFPPKTAYACMSETIMLALDNRYESFTLGKDVSIAQAEETTRLAKKHGFQLAGYRSFEREVTQETIEKTRQRAQEKRK